MNDSSNPQSQNRENSANRLEIHSGPNEIEHPSQQNMGRNTHAQSKIETKIGLSIASNSRGRATTTQIMGYTNSNPESRVKPIAREKSWVKAMVIHIPAEIGPLEAVSPARCMHNQEEPRLVREEDELTSACASLCEHEQLPYVRG